MTRRDIIDMLAFLFTVRLNKYLKCTNRE